MSDEPKVKVTDKRMFTPDGELREEYRALGSEATPEEATATSAPAGPATAPEPPPPSTAEAAAGGPRPSAPPLEFPSTPGALGTPTFMDLLSVLAEPVAIYLGDARLPDGRSAENLDMARLHIDLLDLLRGKTVGNLSAQEAAVLEDLLYRFRMRYVQKRG